MAQEEEEISVRENMMQTHSTFKHQVRNIKSQLGDRQQYHSPWSEDQEDTM